MSWDKQEDEGREDMEDAVLVIGAIAMGGSAAQGMCTALFARIFPSRKRFAVVA